MEQYKKVRLLSLREMRNLYTVGGKKPVETGWGEFLVGEDLYLDPVTSFSKLTDSITIPGVFDFAVPQSWFDKVQPQGMNRAVWWYPPIGEEGHTLGKPLTLREMIQMLKKEYKEAKKTALINAAETVIRLARERMSDLIDSSEDNFSEEELQACNILEEYLRKQLDSE